MECRTADHIAPVRRRRLTAQLKQAHARKSGEIVRYEHAVRRALREVADALAGRETYLKQLAV